MGVPADERLQCARMAVVELVTAVTREGSRGAFWLPRLQDLRDTLADDRRPAQQVLTDAASLCELLYAAPRDNFADFYLVNVDPQTRAADNRRLTAAAENLRTALHAATPDHDT